MFKVFQCKLFYLILIMMIGLISVPALMAAQAEDPSSRAQASAPPPSAPLVIAKPAPLPAQLLSAKKVFISNAGGELKDWFSGGPNRCYDEFYADMKDWGRYELVAAPTDADLIFEIHAGGLYLTEAEEIPKFELTIYDPRTHVTLWAFAERLEPALRKGHRDENFSRGINKLVERVKQLMEPAKS